MKQGTKVSKKRLKCHYFTQAEVMAQGFSLGDIRYYLGEPDKAAKGMSLYLKSRVAKVLESQNWIAWSTGKGIVQSVSQKGNPVVSIMDGPKCSLIKAVQRKNKKWYGYQRLGHSWRSIAGAVYVSKEDAIDALKNHRVPSYQEFIGWGGYIDD
ncbi:MAG: hypothetical protein F6K35_24185 [Okeania sp. SIO2H7]|nr:hypothetical protein [Okeania sp. SIO2H7]